jgi:hypothetical protein
MLSSPLLSSPLLSSPLHSSYSHKLEEVLQRFPNLDKDLVGFYSVCNGFQLRFNTDGVDHPLRHNKSKPLPGREHGEEEGEGYGEGELKEREDRDTESRRWEFGERMGRGWGEDGERMGRGRRGGEDGRRVKSNNFVQWTWTALIRTTRGELYSTTFLP